MTISPKVIVVYGATGKQGRAVADSLLKSQQKFIVRALTRDPESKSAKELAQLGAQVVKADGWKDEDMTAALTGAWGFWLNTHHHDPAVISPGGPTDEDLGRRLVEIAAKAGVKVFIYSTCESPAEFSNGKVPVHGMDAKHRVELYARQFNEFDSVIGAFPGWYFENYITPEYAAAFGGFPITPDADGIYTFTSPVLGGENTVQTVSVADDFGEMVHGMFLDPLRWKNQTIQLLSDSFSYEDMVKVFTDVTGKPARYVPMASYKDFQTHGSTVLQELQDVYRWTQWSGGLFFGRSDDFKTCQFLKDEARRDKGLGPQPVIKLREYFVKHYGNQRQ
ncbi:NAD(P)-binding protein [Aspergillus uvarum CBS 121591]|uniref:NAD(P)-binding protein n=1 Tax=Aspergillus uvarum CBS 121591 TaxID=1448315 RepID=A0A319CHZ7_9EURO|nr:NAD(P)-binding protein [Aspergillus uvarum CBS 121591]PYH85265.1 NAD(P)-binding protein [Aspergillus uvarum CBS 121591]